MKILMGTVESFNDSRGCGYIRGEDGIKYWVHFSNIHVHKEFKTLEVGQEVVFAEGPRQAGRDPTATEVRKLAPSDTLQERIVALMQVQLRKHRAETNGIIDSGDGKSAASHAYAEGILNAALHLMEKYADERQD